jgi:hypothetical protein
MNFREAIFREGCVGPLKHRVDFILVATSQWSEREKVLRSCGQVAVTSEGFMLVRVEEKFRWRPDTDQILEQIERQPGKRPARKRILINRSGARNEYLSPWCRSLEAVSLPTLHW